MAHMFPGQTHPTRDEVLSRLAERLAALRPPHPLRVAIDGVDGAGKTTFADALAPHVERRDRPVIRASVDDFHRPRAERYRRGADSPEGYYRDSFDYPAFQDLLLRPLGPGGDRRYRAAAYDVRADAPRLADDLLAPADAVVLVDGIFLQRPELRGAWEYAIFLAVPFDVALRRMLRRDYAPAEAAEATARYLRRYLPGQRLYLEEVRPRERAQAVLDNTDPGHPRLVHLG
jgi:uridine kinase